MLQMITMKVTIIKKPPPGGEEANSKELISIN